MKITPKILSIPPYLSTSWKNIASLHLQGERGGLKLMVTLQNGFQIEIPSLTREEVDEIFAAHARFTAGEEKGVSNPFEMFRLTLPFKSEGGGTLDAFGSAMQHCEGQASLPSLPPEALQKIVSVARAFGLEENAELPPPEPNCNCIFCQVVRALKGEASADEPVADEELQFRTWDVSQTDEKIYQVTNPLDQNEHYNVFLGEPLGCTCGEKNCEHIRAVLNT